MAFITGNYGDSRGLHGIFKTLNTSAYSGVREEKVLIKYSLARTGSLLTNVVQKIC